jgi:hypothetical protein
MKENINDGTLFEAIKSRDIGRVKEALNKTTNLGIRDQNQNTALHIAAQYPDYSIFNRLVDRMLTKGGLNVNAKNTKGFTALHIVAQKAPGFGFEKMLINAGANVMAKDNIGNTAFHYIAKGRKDIYGAINTISKAGGRVDVSNHAGKSPSDHFSEIGSRPENKKLYGYSISQIEKLLGELSVKETSPDVERLAKKRIFQEDLQGEEDPLAKRILQEKQFTNTRKRHSLLFASPEEQSAPTAKVPKLASTPSNLSPSRVKP